MTASQPSGIVFDIQRFSLHDGPGIRTTVFLKGCPLRCRWCHNPEALAAAPQLSYRSSLCLACGACRAACLVAAVDLGEDGKPRIDRSRCQACFRCVGACPAGALERIGRRMAVDEVMREVEADQAFYRESGGGLTLSGGEPLSQAEFGLALLQAARGRGIATCVETCGFAPWETVAAWAPFVDLWLYDWKETDPARHQAWTGKDNRLILDNLRRLDAAGARIMLRCPLVPGANLRPDHLEGIARLSRELEGCEAVTVIGYHRLGEGKRARFGLPEPADPFVPDEAAITQALETLSALGARNPSLSV